MPFVFSNSPAKALRSCIVLLAISALLGGCSLFSSDPRVRTPGAIIDDVMLEDIVAGDIRRADSGFKSAHLVVVSYNGLVLLAGQVANADLKAKAATLARNIPKVRSVHNALTVGGPISYVARANDSWLTGKVKTRLFAGRKTKARKLKVVTENGVVYLLGILLRSEAEAATAAARQVYGVQQIVKVFEYLDNTESNGERAAAD